MAGVRVVGTDPDLDPDIDPDIDLDPDPNRNPKIDLREGKHHGVKWTVVPLCVEVGLRGAINEQPWNWMCKRLGFSKCSKRRLTQRVQDAAVACSYYIFL